VVFFGCISLPQAKTEIMIPPLFSNAGVGTLVVWNAPRHAFVLPLSELFPENICDNRERRPAPSYAMAAGMLNWICVPELILLQTSSRPPTTSARSRMPGKPK
jgi:hypothetical protein